VKGLETIVLHESPIYNGPRPELSMGSGVEIREGNYSDPFSGKFRSKRKGGTEG